MMLPSVGDECGWRRWSHVAEREDKDLVVRFTNNVAVGRFLHPREQKLLENAAMRVLAS